MTESTPAGGGPVRSRRARTYSMIDFLAKQGGRKYQRALNGERLAYFSLIGTQDWEDYANLSFTAMQAESLTDIDMRLEALTAAVVHLDRRLLRIVELLETGVGVIATHDPDELERLVEGRLGRGAGTRAEAVKLSPEDAAEEAGVQEWTGPLLEVALDPVQPTGWSAITDGTGTDFQWAVLAMGPDQAGRLMLTVSVWGQAVAEIPANRMPDHPELVEAIGSGVNVGVIELCDQAPKYWAKLHLGKRFPSGPAPPWE